MATYPGIQRPGIRPPPGWPPRRRGFRPPVGIPPPADWDPRRRRAEGRFPEPPGPGWPPSDTPFTPPPETPAEIPGQGPTGAYGLTSEEAAFFQKNPYAFLERLMGQSGQQYGPFANFRRSMWGRGVSRFQLLQSLREALGERMPGLGALEGAAGPGSFGNRRRDWIERLLETPKGKQFLADNPQLAFQYLMATRRMGFSPFGEWLGDRSGDFYREWQAQAPEDAETSFLEWLMAQGM